MIGRGRLDGPRGRCGSGQGGLRLARRPRDPDRRSLAAVGSALLVALLLTGCARAVYTHDSSRAGLCGARTPPRDVRPGWTKAEVLRALGPPSELRSQPDGDLFVYRQRLFERRVWNVATRMTSAELTVYQYDHGLNRTHALHCWFDRDGVLVDVAATRARGTP